jgi:DNA-directed RNA polymerase specialized sigma subunit
MMRAVFTFGMIWRMWEAYQEVARKYPRLPLAEERRLIALAQAGRKESADELVLRHLGFVMWRLRRRVFRSHLDRYGEDLLSAAIPVLYEKVETYNLRYRSREGALKPVRFGSYIWKRIDGMAIDYLRKERRVGGLPYDDTRLLGSEIRKVFVSNT